MPRLSTQELNVLYETTPGLRNYAKMKVKSKHYKNFKKATKKNKNK